jgi:predicted lipoprotein with Yx(FWY)xxD motif
MKSTFQQRPFRNAGSIATLALALAVSTVVVSTAPAWASGSDAATTCATPVAAAPAGPATVSAASSPTYHRTLVVGSGPNAGCELYMLTSDMPNASPPHYACSNNDPGSCPTVIWPALLTNGAPIAGPGINPTLLGTVTRTDILANTPVQQVTYGGFPVYQFFQNHAPGETHGANLFDPFTNLPGIWYLQSPGRGLPDPGVATLSHQTVSVTATGNSAVVLAALEDQGLGGQPFPVYSFSADSAHESACLGLCAVIWPPVLTNERAQASDGVTSTLIGTVERPDGTHQVSYAGHPLYLFIRDAALPGTPGVAHGSGIMAFGGTFNLIPAQ